MSVTKMHFEMIANVLKNNRPNETWSANKASQWNAIANDLALNFARINPKFDRDRFLKACGGIVDHQHSSACSCANK